MEGAALYLHVVPMMTLATWTGILTLQTDTLEARMGTLFPLQLQHGINLVPSHQYQYWMMLIH